MEDSQALIDSLRDQLKVLLDENKMLKNKPRIEYIEKTDDTTITELTRQATSLQDDKSKYQQLVARLEVNLEAKEEKIKSLENELEETQVLHRNQVDSLQRALSDRNTIIDRILNLQKEQEQELSALKEKLSNAERGLLEEQQYNRIESQRVDQLQSEKNMYMMDAQHTEKRYKELQDQLTEQQQQIQEFYSKESREKDRKLILLQQEIDDMKNVNKRRIDEMTKEMEKQLELQRNMLIKELGKNDSSKEVFWNKEREMLKSQIESLSTRLLEQENLVVKLKNKGNTGQHKDLELETMRYSNMNLKSEVDNLKLTLNELKSQNSELFTRIENKHSEIKELIIFKEKYEIAKEDTLKKKNELNRRNEELSQFNIELITLRERVRTLLRKIDEVTNEKTFFESKVEKLKTKLMDVLYNEDKNGPLLDDPQQIKGDIKSKFIRIKEPK